MKIKIIFIYGMKDHVDIKKNILIQTKLRDFQIITFRLLPPYEEESNFKQD